MTRITRVEVIDENGRSYVNWKEDNDITLSYQDNEKTLKIFVNTVKPKTGEEGALEALEEWLGPQGPVGPGPGPKGVIDGDWGDWEEWLGEEPPEEQKLSPIEQTKKDIENLQNKLKLLEYQETVRTDVEKAYRDFYGHYPIIDMSTNDFDCVTWVAFKEGYKAGRKPKEYQPTSEKSEKEQQMKELIRESVKWCEEHPEESVEDYLTPQERGDRIHKEVENEIEKLQEKNWYVAEENEWKTVALLFGKKLPVIPPYGYDELSPNAWYMWVVFNYDYYIKQRDIESGRYPTPPQTPEQIEKSLREAFKKVQQTEEWKETQRKIDGKNPPEFLKFELGKTLEGLIEEWWCDVFTRNSDLSMEESIDCLVTMICYWLPKEQSAKGTQNAYVECSVEGFNDCLNKIRRKLR